MLVSDFRPPRDSTPKYFDLLTPHDQADYADLRSALSSQLCRNCRGKRVENFGEMMNVARTFCIQHNDDDWKRCIVCGVYWMPNGIAINHRQVSILLNKCKSSINGSLHKLGYSTLRGRTESGKAVAEAMPVLKDNFNELREWTVRLLMSAYSQANLPSYTVDTRGTSQPLTGTFDSGEEPSQLPYGLTPAVIAGSDDVEIEPAGLGGLDDSWRVDPFLMPGEEW
jgi:hypothetical protein